MSVAPIQGNPLQARYCQYCGRELASDAKFCSYCGTSVTAPIPPPPAIQPPTIKVSHIKRNILIVGMLVLLIAIVMAGLSRPGPETGTKTTTPTPQLGGTIRIGQPFILKEGSENIPVEITFISAWFTTYNNSRSANIMVLETGVSKGYIHLFLEIQAKNIGMKEIESLSTMRWEVTVDKGYIYEEKRCGLTGTMLRPEEMKTGRVVFEILATTTPVEVRYYDSYWGNNPAFILDLRGETIPKNWEEKLLMENYNWSTDRTALTIYIRNVGPAHVVIERYLVYSPTKQEADAAVNTTIAANSVEPITISTKSLVSGVSYTIVLETSRDSSFDFTVIAP